MKTIIIYLVLVGIIAATVSSVAAALANDVTCTLGSYGKEIAQQEGRC